MRGSWQVVDWDRVSNSRGSGNGCLLATLDKHHVDHADYHARFRIINRTATISGVGCGIKLEYVKRTAFELLDELGIQLAGIASRDADGRYRRNHSTMCDR